MILQGLTILFLSATVYCASEDIARANTGFGFNLYRKIREHSGDGDNLFFSPFSVSSAFALLYYGARGQCAAQLAEHLGYPNEEASHQSYKELNEIIFAGSAGNTVLTQANRLFGQEGIDFKEEYRKGLEKYYNAPTEELDFAGDAEAARQHINDWVESQTNDKIQELFPQGTITPQTVFVLANAIYFKAIWQYQFDKESTRSRQFTLQDGSRVNADFMNQKMKVRANLNDENLNAKILELPYNGNKTALYIIMPQGADNTIDDLEEKLSYDSLKTAIDDMNVFASGIQVSIPKFKITWKLSLVGLLYEMGLKCPFGPGADFSGILEDGGTLFADEVVHQAYVDVNEEGTEAAAATGIAVSRTLSVNRFVADSPFIFLIREKQTGDVLFLGRVNNPGTTDDESSRSLKFARFKRSELSAEAPDTNYKVMTASSSSFFSSLVLTLLSGIIASVLQF